ncbi:hypothetical protein SAMN05444358_10364 [Ruegeria halocynthiae]|uniref:Uncharacterized protein n=1 Tax=Ruegeria halocynthiae TaxID=985054 RepID=A0A1H2Z1W9_9RHOB|nr:hypothetical protein [Ruegeria halocynthiae]SDX11410.1 hypothetical protein SAMN05444358_10364 [Ruegeria halocynthiae]
MTGIVELGKGVRVWDVSKGIVGQMTYGYDKPLHAPLQLKPMESLPRDLDEEALDVAIADILNQEDSARKLDAGPPPLRPEFPVLQPQESSVAHADLGLSSVLRQKWAQLSGAA